MGKFFYILKSRNFLLILALVLGLSYQGAAPFFKQYTIFILAIVMTFSITGISTHIFKDYNSVLKITLHSLILNYLLFGTVLLTLAYILFPDKDLFMGYVVIAATPPGIAVIPFTFNFKGDLDYSFKGLLGVYVSAIILTPLIISFFGESGQINGLHILVTIGELILIPLVVSRFLRHKNILPFVNKIRGHIVDYGFALIIYTGVALNKHAIFSDYSILIKSSIILYISMFLLDKLYIKIFKNKLNRQLLISHSLMLSIKSSGFAIATALTFVGERAAIPASILSVFVLIFLIYKSFNLPQKEIKDSKNLANL